MLLDDLRLEGPVPIPRRLQSDLAKGSFDCLGRFAVARVAAVVPAGIVLIVADMLGHLRGHRPFQQLLGQLLQQPVFTDQILRLFVVLQQVINQLVINAFVFGHLFSCPPYTGWHSMTIYTKLFTPSEGRHFPHLRRHSVSSSLRHQVSSSCLLLAPSPRHPVAPRRSSTPCPRAPAC